MNNAKNDLPDVLIEYINSGKINQWKKFPNVFFVPNVEKARIVWDKKKKVIGHKYLSGVGSEEQRKLFATTYNEIYREITGS